MKKKIKNANKKPPRGRYFINEKNRKKSADRKILKAAEKVFAQHPYNAATTRMIAKEAGVDHPLIYYYFGSKEKLFEAVTARMYEEFRVKNIEWLEGLDRVRPSKGLALYLDRLMEYSYEKPEPFQLILTNMAQIGSLDAIPGHEYIIKHLNGMIDTFQEKFPQLTDRSQIEKFLHCFNNLVISLLGAKTCHAQTLNIDPDGSEFRRWIVDTLYTLFLPWLEKLFQPAGSDD